ncbi:MAG: hypothetical protein KAI40_07880 [Desulfobacterales bacterium]|nr:hypothetical protein [Desulfobacterales bacterium]
MKNGQNEKSNIKIVATILLSLIIVFLIFGAEASSNSEQTGDKRGCEKNFSYDGNFFSGRTFKTHQLIENVTVHDAVVRAAKFISRDGYHK